MTGRAPTDVSDLTSEGRSRDLGEILVERRLVSRRAMEAARAERGVTGARLGAVLVRNGFISQRDLIEAMVSEAPAELAGERVSRVRVPADLLRRHGILLAAESAEALHVASRSDEAQVRSLLSEYHPDKEIRFVAYDPVAMSEFLARLQSGAVRGEEVADVERLDRLIEQAHDQGASDIHIIPKGRSYSVMFRLLGDRRLVHEGPPTEYSSVVAQVKNRAGMDIAETRLPQDGVFQVEFGSKLVDFRCVTVPVQGGEYVVMRLLDPDAARRTLDGLGVSRIDHWRRGFTQANGLCLICGPTGSGKTTTLNATVAELDRFGKAIFTVEDPVEYFIAYAGQVSINTAVGLDYPRALRAFMRADPDVINIGEVRDTETAATMIKAAETGHMVLATLHASTIRGAVSRLEYLDIPPRDLRLILRAVMVQNLVRTLCPSCGGRGCDDCGETGYRGRRIVSEVTSFRDPESFDRMIAGEIDWPTLLEDAISLVAAGVTDAREIERLYGVVGLEALEARGLGPG